MSKSRITKIQQNNSNKSYDLGATFDNVIYKYDNDSKSFSLEDLYDYLKEFFENTSFVMYSNQEPKNDSNIHIWFKTNIQDSVEGQEVEEE